MNSKLGRITTSGIVDEFPYRHPVATCTALQWKPDGALWFVESDNNTIARALLPNARNSTSRVGIFREGFFWLTDVDGSQQFNQLPDQAIAFGGITGDIPITGDWTVRHTKLGFYRPSNGLFILDTNGNGQFDVDDYVYNLGVGG